MLNKKKIVIVGGSSGIGLNLSQHLLNRGAKIIIGSRSSEKLKTASSVLNNKVSSLQLNASDENSVCEFFNEIGEFDHLVVTIKPEHVISEFVDTDITGIRHAFESKFWGQYNLVLHCLKTISKQGSIVLTSGIASKRSYKGFSGVAAINGAIESLVKSLSGEINPVRINVVSPGFIERYSNDEERYNTIKVLGANPLINRLGTQDEVSQAYIYLLENNYTTGSLIVVDGGELCV